MLTLVAKHAHRRRCAGIAAGTLMVALASLVPDGPATATYAGGVGRLAFGISVNGNVDVYSALPDGSGLQRLSDDPGFDACPSYSPSGRRIAFCSDRSGAFEIWTMNAAGQAERQLTHLDGYATFPDFSPSGNHVAFGGSQDPDKPNDIWRVRDDGSHLKQLTYTPAQSDEFPVWRPGHDQIAYVRFDDPYIGTQIWLMDANGKRQHLLTDDDTVKDQLPDWSPDGRRLAYAADGDIWVMRADGSHQRNLTDSGAEEFGAAWSPDGSRIAFLREEGATRPVYTMAADGSDEQILLQNTTDRQYVPAWQPAPRDVQCTPRVKDLGALRGGRFSAVMAMNGHGLIVGSSRNANGAEKAVRWRHGRIEDLGLRGEAWAADVNDRGVVVGDFAIDRDHLDRFTGHVFVWRRGESHRLPGLGGTAEGVRRLNEHNQIVGSALDPRGREHPVMWQHGRIHDLGIPDGYAGGYALGINERGDIVGAVFSRTEFRAWAWSTGGGSHPLDRKGTAAQANVIDDAGRAMGISDFGGNPGFYAALWPGHRVVEPLGVFGTSEFSFALGTSDKGDVVGSGDYYAGENLSHVFLRRVPDYDVLRTQVRYPLRTLMPLSGDPADFSNAHAVLRNDPPIADEGTVTVGGTSATGVGRQAHATLWTCAYRQAFVPDEQLTSPSSRSSTQRAWRLTHRLDVDRLDFLRRA